MYEVPLINRPLVGSGCLAGVVGGADLEQPAPMRMRHARVPTSKGMRIEGSKRKLGATKFRTELSFGLSVSTLHCLPFEGGDL